MPDQQGRLWTWTRPLARDSCVSCRGGGGGGEEVGGMDERSGTDYSLDYCPLRLL